DDKLVYERKELPGWIVIGDVTEDGRYLLVSMFEGAENKNSLYYADLGRPATPNIAAPVKALARVNDAEYLPVGNKGTTLFLRLDKDAPNRRIVAVDLTRPEPPAWKTIVPEKREAIESAALSGGRFVVQYLVDVQSRILLFGLDGQPQGEVGLPGPGTVGQIRGRQDASQIWYGFSSVLTPST